MDCLWPFEHILLQICEKLEFEDLSKMEEVDPVFEELSRSGRLWHKYLKYKRKVCPFHRDYMKRANVKLTRPSELSRRIAEKIHDAEEVSRLNMEKGTFQELFLYKDEELSWLPELESAKIISAFTVTENRLITCSKFLTFWDEKSRKVTKRFLFPHNAGKVMQIKVLENDQKIITQHFSLFNSTITFLEFDILKEEFRKIFSKVVNLVHSVTLQEKFGIIVGQNITRLYWENGEHEFLAPELYGSSPSSIKADFYDDSLLTVFNQRDITWSPKIIFRKLDEKFPLWSQKLTETQFVYDAKFSEKGNQVIIANLSQCKRSDIEIRILSAKDGTALQTLDIIFPFKVVSIGYEFIALGGRDNVLLLNTKNIKEKVRI
ncbi:Oidioi.mRNA.OKI2018_I69.chr1.g304.t1.cds [Oikopleura dioica]|uniref:Oidioi.mRNA.OKI2018_I69.chr1.g304.t1.cds n=1 Tax=Oikopleura dioica TaxID=34765 RepID=A0ABN7STP9_OIKDI|nr:Oidioi.mRNA.OKI2018_I69.chr1.g304.t1.cds [Oikopleura dioica]